MGASGGGLPGPSGVRAGQLQPLGSRPGDYVAAETAGSSISSALHRATG